MDIGKLLREGRCIAFEKSYNLKNFGLVAVQKKIYDQIVNSFGIPDLSESKFSEPLLTVFPNKIKVMNTRFSFLKRMSKTFKGEGIYYWNPSFSKELI